MINDGVIRLLLTFAIALQSSSQTLQAGDADATDDRGNMGDQVTMHRSFVTIVIRRWRFRAKTSLQVRQSDTQRRHRAVDRALQFRRNGYEPSTVTAHLRGRRLYYRFGHGLGRSVQSCR
jgi:hypothetical protein